MVAPVHWIFGYDEQPPDPKGGDGVVSWGPPGLDREIATAPEKQKQRHVLRFLFRKSEYTEGGACRMSGAFVKGGLKEGLRR